MGFLITSGQNPKLKLARALLGRPKERREAGGFLAEGVRLLEEALAADWPVRFVLYSDGLSHRGQALVASFKARGLDVEEVSSDLLHAVSETETSQGVLAVLDDHLLPLPETPEFILIPDQIRDPGNLGTLIRSAAAAGVQAVLLPPDTTDAFAPKVVRSAMGAHFRLPLQSLSWETIRELSQAANLSVFLADMGGKPCWETEMHTPCALIIGGEAEGASEEAGGLATQRVSIPMPGAFESLNAGVAGALLMFEVVRQRSGGKA
jgi:TrmH family RNA methyltransferase